jgi:hypothetical protein
VPAPPGSFVGLEFDTLAADGPVLVSELVLDGGLVSPDVSRCNPNLRLYDVTPGEPARLLRALRSSTSPRNHRTFFPVDWPLEPGRVYRALCRVTSLPSSPYTPTPAAALASRGGFHGTQDAPCNDAAALVTPRDEGTTSIELRYRTSRASPSPRR